MTALVRLAQEQAQRNRALLADTPLAADRVESRVLPLRFDLASGQLSGEQALGLAALEKQAAAIAIKSLISLAKAGDIDHLGGGLELIAPLLMTLGIVDYEHRHYTIEHGHTSIGYFAALAALGFLPEARVEEKFRRSLDIAGHVSYVPGGSPFGSGRLGVMMPVSAGLALGLKALTGPEALVVCHCGDAGWISGQALNGFLGASLHQAPVMWVMHRNGIQLSAPTAKIMSRDPRSIVSALGIQILEIPTLTDRISLFKAYGEAFKLAQAGKPSMIYPVGYGHDGQPTVTVRWFGEQYGIVHEVEEFAAKQKVALDTKIRVPGSLMSYRDAHAMIECVFYVNGLPGGEGHHDGGMKGRDGQAVLANPLLQLTSDEQKSLDRLRAQPPRAVVSTGRPARGSVNLPLTDAEAKAVALPGTDKWVSARAGSEAAYAAVAKKYPERCFFVSCDLNPSTKLGKAAALVPPHHAFEMSIEEQAASLMTDGLSCASIGPQLNVFATFAAFMEGIAREGFEMWRYQRNLNQVNEGLNVVMHLSHVGACTGRDHFSGWSLDWINFALGYLPFLRRFYAPADARSAFIAVRDAAAAHGGHIVAIPRDNLPVLTTFGSSDPLWQGTEAWEAVTPYRTVPGAKVAVLTMGAPSYLAGAASDAQRAQGVNADVYIVNGFPLDGKFVAGLAGRYKKIVTLEDGLIGTPESGLRGLAAFVVSSLAGSDVAFDHFGIEDPSVAPSDHFVQVWEHFGMTQARLEQSLAT